VLNLSLICGEVVSEPELRFTADQPESNNASFTVDMAWKGTTRGWIKVYCYQENAEFAAERIHKGTRVLVVGPLVRTSLKVEEDIWWSEVAVVANILQVIEEPVGPAGADRQD
jgi:single-stranded DNA-binding protein